MRRSRGGSSIETGKAGGSTGTTTDRSSRTFSESERHGQSQSWSHCSAAATPGIANAEQAGAIPMRDNWPSSHPPAQGQDRKTARQSINRRKTGLLAGRFINSFSL